VTELVVAFSGVRTLAARSESAGLQTLKSLENSKTPLRLGFSFVINAEKITYSGSVKLVSKVGADGGGMKILGSVTDIWKAVETLNPSLSVAVTVTVLVAAAGGVPLKVRVTGSKASQAGPIAE